MNAKTHTLPAGSIESKFVPVPAPDLMELIEKSAPGKDGLSLLYSVAGGLDFKVARLAAMITNTMAAHLKAGDVDRAGIDKYNDALNSLDMAEARDWAFDQAGISQRNMVNDLTELVNFRMTVVARIAAVTGKPFASRWDDTITKAATPQAVEEWKLDMSWSEYVEGCHGKVEMVEAEFKKMKSLELVGAKQNWADYASQIISTIEHAEDEPLEFEELSVETQKAMLTNICTPEKEARFRTSAMKIARSPEDLHTRRLFISSFCTAARTALTHIRYADQGEVFGAKEQNEAYAKRRISNKAMEAHNDDYAEA